MLARSSPLEILQEAPADPLPQSKIAHLRNPFKVPEADDYAVLRQSRRADGPPGRPPPAASCACAGRLRRSLSPGPAPGADAACNSGPLQGGLREFIHQKRELFLSDLAIETAEEELQRLERLERGQVQQLAAKEQEITLVREQFRGFLEGDGKVTMECRRAAEAKARERIDIVRQIKQISSAVSALRSDIAHHNERLQECQDYKAFLEALTPREWRRSHPAAFYFTQPQQLLDIMSALEEQNMFLITHCQEAEERLERCRARFNEMLDSHDGAIEDMRSDRAQRVAVLAASESRNERYRTDGDFKHGNELGEGELLELQRAIADFNRQLGFDSASSNTSTMLSTIERKMQELSDNLSLLDSSVLKQQTLALDGARRAQERADRNVTEKKQQEEKVQKALQLAMMPTKKRVGRPLMERIIPTMGDSREKMEEEERQRAAQAAADEDLLGGEIWD
jgi:hypothetical protein